MTDILKPVSICWVQTGHVTGRKPQTLSLPCAGEACFTASGTRASFSPTALSSRSSMTRAPLGRFVARSNSACRMNSFKSSLTDSMIALYCPNPGGVWWLAPMTCNVISVSRYSSRSAFCKPPLESLSPLRARGGKRWRRRAGADK